MVFFLISETYIKLIFGEDARYNMLDSGGKEVILFNKLLNLSGGFMRLTAKLVLLFLVLGTLIISGCGTYLSREARQQFEEREESFSVTVYPVSIVVGSERQQDTELASEITDFINDNDLADAVMGEGDIEIPVKWEMDQSKMARRSALSYAEQMKSANIMTDYALLVEILCNSSETNVGGVHYFLCDKEGNLADRGLNNSHWENFKKVKPHDRKGGAEVAKLMLTDAWDKRGNKTQNK